MKVKPFIIPLLASTLLASACGETLDTEEFRTLPVAAMTVEGVEVLAGTYDEATSELVLIPTFVDKVKLAAGEQLELVSDEQRAPLELRSSWDTQLEVGAILELVSDSTDAGGVLIVHAPEWTDGLSEAEAASSFTDCWDPNDGPFPIPQK